MGELTPKTQPRPAVEGQVSISNVGKVVFLPSLRPKVHCIVAV